MQRLRQVLDWPRPAKRLFVVAVDIIMAVLATWVAYSLRYETLHWPSDDQWWVYILGPVLAVPIFARFGLYRAIFRYTGMDVLFVTGQAIALYALIRVLLLYWVKWPVFPLTLGVLQPIIFFVLIGSSRVLARYVLAGIGLGKEHYHGRMLIFGAGAAGVQTSSAMAITGHVKLLGFVDEDPAKIGQTINGVPVFSALQVPVLVRELGITDILLAIPSASRDRRNKIIQSLRTLPVHTRTLPGLADLTSGRVTVRDFRELDVEDLLGRAAVAPQAELLACSLFNQTILVTGAGGSIGSELCRQILLERPRRLLLLDHNEFGLYTLHRELQAWCHAQTSDVELVPLLASVANRQRLDWICAQYRPDTVYHAAAYKHVPMVECNPSEGIFNNVFGTLNMAQAAQAARVASFVLVSTDKAVRPTNLMGASKRMAELILQAMADRAGTHDTRFCLVRFGNVLGSSGSVVPMFREQLSQGGPLTITHPEVTRYFMTIPEAAQLVLQAAAMATGGEVFVLDMGEPVKILDLARRLVGLSGLQVRDATQPDGDIEFSFIGLRPGEKLYEELLIGDNPTATAHPRIMKAHEDFMAWPELMTKLEQLQQAARAENVVAIRQVLRACVHGFHDEVGP
ncbi:MAG: nucleoside-diphosphate sugar epimerase/dehydratase [Burkholderiales bacterium]|nr:nucleoside-diphosphate sugar epimerase/dehydratase [Burkholderiales bacterium]